MCSSYSEEATPFEPVRTTVGCVFFGTCFDIILKVTSRSSTDAAIILFFVGFLNPRH